MSRPTKHTPKLEEAICERLMGGESLIAICKGDDMPSAVTVYTWLRDNEEFRKRYAFAREVQTEFYVNEVIDISDEIPVHQVPDPDGGVSVRIDPAGITRNRLRVDTRKWIASKLMPKKYGDKIAQEISGPSGGNIGLNVHFLDGPDEDAGKFQGDGEVINVVFVDAEDGRPKQ